MMCEFHLVQEASLLKMREEVIDFFGNDGIMSYSFDSRRMIISSYYFLFNMEKEHLCEKLLI